MRSDAKSTSTPAKRELTARQAEIYAYIAERCRAGIPPTMREISGHFGFHVSAAYNHVIALAKKGWINKGPGAERAIGLVKDPHAIPLGVTLPTGRRITWVAAVLLALWPGLRTAADTVTQAVLAHRGQLSETAQASTVYLTLRPAEGDAQADLAAAIKLMVAQSSRQVVIQHCRPEPLGVAPVLTVSLASLRWSVPDFAELLAAYPYSDQEFPAVIRADWLLLQLADGTASPAYRRLLLGRDADGNDLATLAQVLQLFKVERDPLLTFGHVEAESGVNKAGVRQIESRPLPRGYCWITSDVRQLLRGVDPMENIGREPAADGQEIIIGIPKVSAETGARGCGQVYFLSDAEGNLVDRAPIDLVEDSTRFRGIAEIRSPGSCIQCHQDGLRVPTLSDYARAQAAGLLFFATDQARLTVDAYYVGDIRADVAEANEQYARFVNSLLTMTPAEASGAFSRAVVAYDAKLDLTAASRELGSTPAELRRALTSAGVALSTRAKGMAHGLSMTRPAFEEQYLELAAAIASLPPVKEQATDDPPDSLPEPTGDSQPTE